jgi:membrane-associated phospholipid phosphatase
MLLYMLEARLRRTSAYSLTVCGWDTCVQLLNEVANQILKRSIQQSRPEGARMSGSGMPSAHSQFIFFFAAYVVAYTWKRCVTQKQSCLAICVHRLTHIR